MYFTYSLLIFLLGILLSPVLAVLFLIKPKLRAGFWQKIGIYPNINSLNTIWIHAVSVGEVNAVENFIKEVRKQYPSISIVLTTVTKTGQLVAKNKLSNVVNHILYFPYDFIFSVKAAIKAIKPQAVIIAETEIWPNFSHEIKKNGTPLIIINGRISPGSYKNYKKFSFFFNKFLNNYSLILMQTDDDKKRIIEIGANPDIAETMGNLKYDNPCTITQNDINIIKESLKKETQKIIIAGSTHKGEDEIILNTYKKLKREHSDLKLIIAPRHPERNNQVLKLISETGCKYGLRSQNNNFDETDIIMIDTMGELNKIYSVCDIAFIGGSFSNTGGHNPLEPAIYGIPVISGPTVFNFKDIYSYMKTQKAAFIVNNEDELCDIFKTLLNNSEMYQKTSINCKNIFETNKGATKYALTKLQDIIK
jgi:3-deoxy-D-manno-octulosonic-acid transferase